MAHVVEELSNHFAHDASFLVEETIDENQQSVETGTSHHSRMCAELKFGAIAQMKWKRFSSTSGEAQPLEKNGGHLDD